MAGTYRVSKSLLRRVAILIAVALAGGGLLVFEHVGTGAATGQPSQVQANTPQPTATANSRTTTSTPRHCVNGLGLDNPKNKHCRPASGA